MNELKPCPFCGSKDIYETYEQEHWYATKNPIIFCNSCKVKVSVEDDSPYMDIEQDYKYRRQKTVTAWNRRADMREGEDNE